MHDLIQEQPTNKQTNKQTNKATTQQKMHTYIDSSMGVHIKLS